MIAILGTVAVLLLAGSIAFFTFTESGKDMRDVLGTMPDALSAPGAAAVAMIDGCRLGAVYERREYLELSRSFPQAKPESKLAPIVVLCPVRPIDSAPSCDRVAKTYLSGGGKAAAFTVIVSKSGQLVCEERFEAPR